MTNKNYYEKIKNKKLIMEWNELKSDITIKYLFNIYNTGYHFEHINNNMINKLFMITCIEGYITYAKSLISRYTINIHFEREYVFQMSCKYGQMDIIKWLIDLGENHGYGKIDLHCDNSLAFRWACRNKYREIADWLIDLGENHGYGKIDQTLIDNYIFLIKTDSIKN